MYTSAVVCAMMVEDNINSELEIDLSIVENIATVYRASFKIVRTMNSSCDHDLGRTFLPPAAAAAAAAAHCAADNNCDNSWSISYTYDEFRKLKQDMKKDNIRMLSPFPNASVMKAIQLDDLIPLRLVSAISLPTTMYTFRSDVAVILYNILC